MTKGEYLLDLSGVKKAFLKKIEKSIQSISHKRKRLIHLICLKLRTSILQKTRQREERTSREGGEDMHNT